MSQANAKHPTEEVEGGSAVAAATFRTTLARACTGALEVLRTLWALQLLLLQREGQGERRREGN